MNELSINFSFKARYYKLGEIDDARPRICFVFHGYGHLAQYFIKKFECISKLGVCVIAPEGLSRFYLEPLDSSGKRANNRIGATWMTRENREMDIENYVNYIQAVYDREMKPGTEVNVIGFSQGGATASRWLLQGQAKFDRLILWAGIFPPDMDFEKGQQIFDQKEVISVFGDDDPLVTPERVKEMIELANKLKIQPRRLGFKGKHELNEELLLELFK